MKQLILALLAVALVACSDNNPIVPVDSFLNCNEISEHYKKYEGEEIKCQFHFILTEYNGQQYIALNSHCADLTRAHVFNMNCVDICEYSPYDPDSECGKYLSDRKVLEIFLIEK